MTASRKFNALLKSFERRRPMRAGSLIVTIYGDAIVPRGGSLWLGSLLDMVAGFGIESGQVRTATSRLVADGWFERTRIGKNSYYCLSAKGAAEFAAATARIYRAGDPPWSGEIDVAIIAPIQTAQRAAIRDRMLRAGYGQAAANVMVRPHIPATSDEPVEKPREIVRMRARLDDAQDARSLAQACWQLADLDAGYRQFLGVFAPVADELADGVSLTDAQAFQLRILLIHDWRRIVLRDPLLPRAMLPDDWHGTPARALVSSVYRQIVARSERWLDKNALNETGGVPPSNPSLAQRFFPS